MASIPGAVALLVRVAAPEQLGPMIFDVPPLFWVVLTTLSVVMLSPVTSAGLGVWCAAQYLLVHHAASPWLEQLQGPELLVRELSSGGAALRRAGTVALSGVLAAGASRIFRGAVIDLLQQQALRERAERAWSQVEVERRQVEAEYLDVEAVSEAKTRFLAEMSHELRTPLGGVIGHANLLLERRDLDADARARLESMLKNARHLGELVEDAMDTALVETGRVSLRPRPFAPMALADEVRALFEPAARGRGVALSVRVGADAPARVVGDPKRVRQILLNLLSNALKHTAEGEVSLRIHGRAPVTFEIRDTGGGVPEGQLDRIFEAYAQAGSAEERARGAGLGLAITRSLVDAMGGQITLESALGVGTTVQVRLPLPDASTPAAPPPAPETLDARIERLPPAEELARLRELADMGDMARLRERLADLAGRPELAAFVDRVDRLARAFDDQAILAVLEPEDDPR